MKVSEGMKKDYERTKREIFTNIVSREENTEAAEETSVGEDRTDIKIRHNIVGAMTAAACVVITAGVVYVWTAIGGVEKLPASIDEIISQPSEESSEEDDGEYGSFLLVQRTSDEFFECEISNMSFEVTEDGEIVSAYAASDQIPDEYIKDDSYNIYTVYEGEITCGLDGTEQKGDAVVFRQLWDTADRENPEEWSLIDNNEYMTSADYEPEGNCVPKNIFVTLKNGELTDRYNSIYAFNSHTLRYDSVFGEYGSQVREWLFDYLKGGDKSVVTEWASGKVETKTNEVYGTIYSVDQVVSLEFEDDGTLDVLVSKGTYEENSGYIGKDYHDVVEYLEKGGFIVNVRRVHNEEEPEDAVVRIVSDEEEYYVRLFVSDGGGNHETDSVTKIENWNYLKAYMGEELSTAQAKGTTFDVYDYECGEITEGFENLDMRIVGTSYDKNEKTYSVYYAVQTQDGSSLGGGDTAETEMLNLYPESYDTVSGDMKLFGSYGVGCVTFSEDVSQPAKDTDAIRESLYNQLVIMSISSIGDDLDEELDGKFVADYML